jgi:hypothetical protein
MIPCGDRDAPLFAGDGDWDLAQTVLLNNELIDGLPAVVPTASRMAAMLGGRNPEESLGYMPPLFGELTNQAIAYCCVIAGCRRSEFPVVREAALATLDEKFNLLGIQTTTGTPTAAVMVRGLAVETLGMNAGTNCLGPGNRANACIGRALRLVLTNIGGARSLVGDMATMGQPAKYGMAFAEGSHALAPAPAESAVTVIGLSGTMEVLPEQGACTPEMVLRPASIAMQGGRVAAAAGRQKPPTEQFLLMPAEMADILASNGWTLADGQAFLLRQSGMDWPIARSAADIRIIMTGGAGVKMTCLIPWGGGTFSVTRPLPPR